MVSGAQPRSAVGCSVLFGRGNFECSSEFGESCCDSLLTIDINLVNFFCIRVIQVISNCVYYGSPSCVSYII
ncbi:hypothetical protein [Rubritalea tangerina]|uniref:hypothetical protein n=1 Tax=Rubritalea tangerina TaxID=430798 RepID=UPI0036168DDA